MTRAITRRLVYQLKMTSLPVTPAPLVFLAAVGCGLMAGVFFAFSTFVMRALVRLPPPLGISAMQSINVTAVMWPFMTLFFGTAILCLICAGGAIADPSTPGRVWQLAGGLAYLAGAVLVTITCNVPRNDRLAVVDPASADGARVWEDYIRTWTAWNHVRTLACTASTAAFILSRF